MFLEGEKKTGTGALTSCAAILAKSTLYHSPEMGNTSCLDLSLEMHECGMRTQASTC